MDFSQYIQYVNDSADERAAHYQNLLDNARQQSVPVEAAPSSSGGASGSFNGKALEEIQNLQKQQDVQNLKNGNKVPLNWSTWYYGGFPNASQNLKDIGTGVVSMFSHPIANAVRFGKYELKNVKNTFNEGRILGEMLKDGNASLGDVVNQIGMMGYVNPLTATVRDAADTWGKSYSVSTKTPAEFVKAGKQGGLKGVVNKGVQQAYDTANAMFQNPVDVGLDLIGLGGGKVLKSALSKTAIGKSINAGETVEKGINVKTAGVQKDINKLGDQLQVIKKDKSIDLEDLVKRAEETGDWTGVPVEQRKLLKNFSDDYHTIAQKHSPSTTVDPEHLTVAQNIARKNNITYREAEKRITALNDSIPQGVDKNIGLKNLAEQGDELAKQVIDAKQGFHEGRLFPITHALAEAVDLEKLGGRVDDLDRIYAGKFSTREYGLTPYAEVAKSLKRPSEFLDGLSQQYVGRSIKDELQSGTLNGKSVASAIEKDNVYIPKASLEGTDTFQKIQEKASTKPVNADDIAIDKRVLKELTNQTKQIGKFFAQDWANDLYAITKGSMLASGTYLGANVIGSGINAIMSSGLKTLDDFAHALKTHGQLSKNLGTYRNVSSLKDVKTPWLKPIQTVNKYTTGAITEFLDRKTQNIFSEMAAHRQLRQRGILPKDRLNALDELDASSLGDVIEGIKAEALLNSTKTTLPRLAVEIGSAQNPFWRWNDTAARSTMYMLEHHPITSNVILNRILADIGFDDEMQNRLNLGVKSDKPFVTYRFDERTGQIKEGSLEWIPQMNTFKLIGTGLDMKEGFFKNPTQAPVFMKIANAFQGKDQYGRALKRAERDPSGRLRHLYDGAKRYYISDNGIVEQGTSADEVISTFAKETIGILNAANKTGLPVAGTLTGNKFYQPYGQSMFGSFGRDELNSNIISGGDPRKPRELADVMSSLIGYYEQPYIPKFESDVPQFSKSSFSGLVRGQRYDLMKKMRGY
jgi:hypothetical protein